DHGSFPTPADRKRPSCHPVAPADRSSRPSQSRKGMAWILPQLTRAGITFVILLRNQWLRRVRMQHPRYLPGGGRIQLEMPQRVVDAEGPRDGPRPSPGWVGG